MLFIYSLTNTCTIRTFDKRYLETIFDKKKRITIITNEESNFRRRFLAMCIQKSRGMIDS